MQAKERQASSGSKWIGATFLPCLCFPRAQLCASGLSTTCSTHQHKAACAARVSTQSPPALCFHHGSARLLALPPPRRAAAAAWRTFASWTIIFQPQVIYVTRQCWRSAAAAAALATDSSTTAQERKPTFGRCHALFFRAIHKELLVESQWSLSRHSAKIYLFSRL